MNILVVIDQSGSMRKMKSEIIDSFNNFLREQKEANPEGKISLSFFNEQVTNVYSMVPIKEAREIKPEDYHPILLTALYDAVGSIVTEADDTPSVLLVMTDGDDNSSEKYTHHAIQTLLDEKRSKGWTIVYLGINIEAEKVAPEGVYRISSNTTTTPETIRVLSRGISQVRKGLKSSILDDSCDC